MNMEEIMNYLFKRSIVGLPPGDLAEVFDKLIWCMDDNGAEIETVRKKWLLSSDREKVEVALGMSETYPYDSRQEMINGFELIKNRWPNLEPKCREILDRWNKQFPDR
ncbi:hypothetical protein [Microbulbifer epialgicus]|uniref:Uncharacterized protein n=1 Tax=Microbulbifer epialgicus TaxID=393907 RepID=A0ABV4P798_9GAMM